MLYNTESIAVNFVYICTTHGMGKAYHFRSHCEDQNLSAMGLCIRSLQIFFQSERNEFWHE